MFGKKFLIGGRRDCCISLVKNGAGFDAMATMTSGWLCESTTPRRRLYGRKDGVLEASASRASSACPLIWPK